MTDDTKQITADNLRADFLNATTNAERWKVLNRALDWAVTASENADAHRGTVQEYKEAIEADRAQKDIRHAERTIRIGKHTIRAGDVITWAGVEKGWIVRGLSANNMVLIAPLAEYWQMRAQRVKAEDLIP